MHTFVKGKDIFFQAEENSNKLFLRSLTEQVHKEVALTIDAWQNDFDAELLDPRCTDWLDDCCIDIDSFDDNSPEYWAVENGTVRELFNRLVLSKIGSVSYEEVYSES